MPDKRISAEPPIFRQLRFFLKRIGEQVFRESAISMYIRGTKIPHKMIRNVTPQDTAAITKIYNEYIAHTVISFETEPLSEAEMQQRIDRISTAFPYLVYEVDGEVSGYCYAHEWKERAAYRHTLETTVYLSPRHTGKGIGRALMQRLIAECRGRGCHALIACITANNEASKSLHAKLGFVQVSHFKSVGYKFGQWLDVVDYELLLTS